MDGMKWEELSISDVSIVIRVLCPVRNFSEKALGQRKKLRI
jgi:hypothetical protein